MSIPITQASRWTAPADSGANRVTEIQTVEVGMNEWGELAGNGYIFTHGVATCIAVVIVHPDARRAWMIHSDHLGQTTQDIDDISGMTGAAEGEGLLVWLFGGGYINGVRGGKREVDAGRKFVVEKLSADLPKAKLTVKWQEGDVAVTHNDAGCRCLLRPPGKSEWVEQPRKHSGCRRISKPGDSRSRQGAGRRDSRRVRPRRSPTRHPRM
jgi:hypothetical protein